MIPNFITHLTFDNCFDESMARCIPSSVTHLKFTYVNEPVNMIPSFITHLTFGKKFDHSIDDVSLSVVEIKLDKEYNVAINEDVRSRVKIIFQ